MRLLRVLAGAVAVAAQAQTDESEYDEVLRFTREIVRASTKRSRSRRAIARHGSASRCSSWRAPVAVSARERAVEFPRTGVYVDDVFDPSPASHAGIQPGDFLVALGIHRVLSVGDFRKWLYLGGIGNEIDVELFRAGKAVKQRLRSEVRSPEATTR